MQDVHAGLLLAGQYLGNRTQQQQQQHLACTVDVDLILSQLSEFFICAVVRAVCCAVAGG
jgi:hypothetical protein